MGFVNVDKNYTELRIWELLRIPSPQKARAWNSDGKTHAIGDTKARRYSNSANRHQKGVDIRLPLAKGVLGEPHVGLFRIFCSFPIDLSN